MTLAKVERYLNSAIRNPVRPFVAGISQLSHLPIPVNFHVDGDDTPVNGLLPDIISQYLYLMEGIREYEPETSLMIRRIVKPGNTVFVVGAHIGIHAILAKQCAGSDGIVIGFEPTPETYAMLERNCKPRGIETEQLAITREGLKSIEMTMFDIRHSAWNSSATARTKNPKRWKPKKITVAAASIDSYCSSKQLDPDVLILDIENGEMDALLGGQHQIKKNTPSIIIECGDLGREEQNSTHACLSLLCEWGYLLFEINSSTDFFPHQLKKAYPDFYPNILAVHLSKTVNS